MKKIKISIILNIIISLLALIATIIMFTGFKFMHGAEPVLETTKLGVFKYFTVDSNIFMGIISLVFVIYEIKLLKENIKEIPTKVYILKLMSTVGVSLTLFVVFVYFVPITEWKVLPMIMNSNLFFHLIIPVLSIISFIFFENTNKLKYKYVLFGLLPTFIYGIYYLINVLVHVENHLVSTKYDFYYFVQNGIWTSAIVIPIIFVITYVISLILWKINRKFY
jgi:hypothetical protein